MGYLLSVSGHLQHLVLLLEIPTGLVKKSLVFGRHQSACLDL